MTNTDGPETSPVTGEDAASTTDAVTVVHNPGRQRYELHEGPDVIGVAGYRNGEGGRRVFDHTEVDPAYGGRGLAARLVRHALDDTVAEGLRIVPVCPYVVKYVSSHHEWDDAIDRPPSRS